MTGARSSPAPGSRSCGRPRRTARAAAARRSPSATAHASMRLRARLALATLGATVPMVLGLMAVDGWERHRVTAYVLANTAELRVHDTREGERCAASPETWGAGPWRPGPGPGARPRQGPPPDGEGPPPRRREGPPAL